MKHILYGGGDQLNTSITRELNGSMEIYGQLGTVAAAVVAMAGGGGSGGSRPHEKKDVGDANEAISVHNILSTFLVCRKLKFFAEFEKNVL